jgi:membrane protease subunit (stomatin/prohibitin family)
MSLRSFIAKQFIDVIDWMEPEDGILAYRYPMQDREIQNGGKLTVRDSQMAVFVNEGQVADVMGPGLYTLTTHTLPILTYLKNWDKAFQSPFKSDVYFYSTRMQINQRWGTANPITFRDKEFGAVRMRGYGIYSYHVQDPKIFYQKISGSREIYHVADLEGQLRNTMIAVMTGTFASSTVPFLDLAANQLEMGNKIMEQMKPAFTDLGLSMDTFVVDNVSLPDELQQMLDQRISMNMIGDMNKFTQFQVAKSIPIAAANEGGGGIAGIGVGLGAGLTMGQQMMNAMQPGQQGPQPPQTGWGAPQAPPQAGPVGGGVPPATPVPPGPAPQNAAPGAAGAMKFCMTCGHQIPRAAKFCAECGGAQQ